MDSPKYHLSRDTGLINQEKYISLITDDIKTTLSGKSYDRAFITISMKEDYVNGSAGAYEYYLEKEIAGIMQKYNIKKEYVSDHLPILYQFEEGHDTDVGFN